MTTPMAEDTGGIGGGVGRDCSPRAIVGCGCRKSGSSASGCRTGGFVFGTIFATVAGGTYSDEGFPLPLNHQPAKPTNMIASHPHQNPEWPGACLGTKSASGRDELGSAFFITSKSGLHQKSDHCFCRTQGLSNRCDRSWKGASGSSAQSQSPEFRDAPEVVHHGRIQTL